MPNHGGIYHAAGSQYGLDSASAWLTLDCGFCGRHGPAAVVCHTSETETREFPPVRWVRCGHCHRGSVVNEATSYPGSMPGNDLEGLPPEVEAAYNEARRCYSVTAFTGCELLCRKLLMHVAVDVASAKPGDSFAAYVSALEVAGYITPPMKGWVDRIREHANESTHELPAPSQDRAQRTLAFTMQLLRIVYEMEYQASKADALEPGAAE